MQTQPPAREPQHRRLRRRRAPIAGALIGIVAGLVVVGVVDRVGGTVTPIGYLGAALLGAVVGIVLAMLVPAEIDDGEDDAHAALFEHGGQPGRADAPVEGAHARDTP
jgi:ammonia channel protein AmtB